ncbi:MAG: hypothetical protein ABI867_26995 [Kofleriaceae bacterium]
MTRLETIAARQRQTRIRDLVFAAFVALAVAIGVASVSTGGTTTPIAQTDR